MNRSSNPESELPAERPEPWEPVAPSGTEIGQSEAVSGVETGNAETRRVAEAAEPGGIVEAAEVGRVAEAVETGGIAEAPETEGAVAGTAEDADKDTESEWWQDESLPWRHKPTRADMACMTWIGVMSVYGLIMLPLRTWLLGLAPGVLLMITGSRTSAAAVGALASQGEYDLWPVALVVATVASIKFDWVFWWAGKLWGRGLIENWAGQSKRAAKNYAIAERWAKKLGWFGIFVAYVPIPLPLMPVIFVLLGASGMKVRTFMLLDALASFCWLSLYIALGWTVGEPAVAALKVYAKYALYFALVVLVVVIYTSYRNSKRKMARSGAAKNRD